jgi:hypothetical protein
MKCSATASRYTGEGGCSPIGNDPPVEHFADFCRRAHEREEEVWPKCLELGPDVVLDFGFWTQRERDATREKILTLGAQVCLYRLACSEHEA